MIPARQWIDFMHQALEEAEDLIPADASIERNGVGNLSIIDVDNEWIGWIDVLTPGINMGTDEV